MVMQAELRAGMTARVRGWPFWLLCLGIPTMTSLLACEPAARSELLAYDAEGSPCASDQSGGRYSGTSEADVEQGIVPPPAVADAEPEEWALIFHDEFEGSALDRGKWQTCYWWDEEGCVNEGNNELQWYLPQNIRIDSGNLHLSAEKQPVSGADGTAFEYTSGMITTGRPTYRTDPPANFAFCYGYAEIRAKVPAGRGLWPAFWLLPADHNETPEIDVMEIIGQRPRTVEMHFHYRDRGRRREAGHSWKGLELPPRWHRFGVDWKPGTIVWYVDGVERWRFDSSRHVPAQPMYLLLNLAVGGDWPGPPDAETPFPSEFIVDYVRVWRREEPTDDNGSASRG
jgi:beta-glucanase (GH16 family)